MRHLNVLPVVLGLSICNFACSGGVQHDSPDNVQFFAPMLLTCADGSTSTVTGVGDFNGDKQPDLVGCVTSTSVSVFMSSGGGFFGNAIRVSVPADTTWVEVHDVDGDGKADIVTESGVGRSILFSKGDGTFNTLNQPNYPGCDTYKYSLDGYANSICYDDGDITVYDMASDGSGSLALTIPAPARPTLIDVDHDGNLDFAYAIGSTIAVQLNAGNASFGPVQVVVVADSEVDNLTAVDIDGDGFTDLVANVGSHADAYYALLHNEAGTGFKAWTTLPDVDDVNYTFQDVTGDYVMDVVLAQDGAIVVMVGKGDGTFEDKGVGITGPWTNTDNFKFTDLNGDGKPDLVVGGSNVSVLLRQ